MCKLQNVIRWTRIGRRKERDHVNGTDRLARIAKNGKPNIPGYVNGLQNVGAIIRWSRIKRRGDHVNERVTVTNLQESQEMENHLDGHLDGLQNLGAKVEYQSILQKNRHGPRRRRRLILLSCFTSTVNQKSRIDMLEQSKI